MTWGLADITLEISSNRRQGSAPAEKRDYHSFRKAVNALGPTRNPLKTGLEPAMLNWEALPFVKQEEEHHIDARIAPRYQTVIIELTYLMCVENAR